MDMHLIQFDTMCVESGHVVLLDRELDTGCRCGAAGGRYANTTPLPVTSSAFALQPNTTSPPRLENCV